MPTPIESVTAGSYESHGVLDIADIGARRGSLSGVWKALLPPGSYRVELELVGGIPLSVALVAADCDDAVWEAYSTIRPVTGVVGFSRQHRDGTPRELFKYINATEFDAYGLAEGRNGLLFLSGEASPRSLMHVSIGRSEDKTVGYRVEVYSDFDGAPDPEIYPVTEAKHRPYYIYDLRDYYRKQPKPFL